MTRGFGRASSGTLNVNTAFHAMRARGALEYSDFNIRLIRVGSAENKISQRATLNTPDRLNELTAVWQCSRWHFGALLLVGNDTLIPLTAK
jgi:hypothetical protein